MINESFRIKKVKDKLDSVYGVDKKTQKLFTLKNEILKIFRFKCLK